MSPPIRVLLAEDSAADAELFEAELVRSGVRCILLRTDTREGFASALAQFAPDLIASDFSMPSFDGMSALQLAREHCPDTPFIFVSGTIGEEAAIRALTHGAADYILKGNLRRLPAAVARVLREAADAAERRRIERELAESNRRYRNLLDAMPEPVIVTRASRIAYANHAAALLYGAASGDDLAGRAFADLVHEDSLGAATIRTRSLGQGAGQPGRRLQVHARLDGSTVQVEVVPVPLDDGDAGELVLIRDAGQAGKERQREAELALRLQEHVSRLEKLGRMRTVLSSIGGAILRTTSRISLLDELCRIAVDDGKLLLAWVALVNADGTELHFTTHAGKGRECFEELRMPLAGAVGDDVGPTRAAVLRDEVVVWDRIQEDASRPAWQERARQLGYRSLIALPLRVEGRVAGAWTLCSEENGFFRDEERKMLLELAADAGLGLGYLDKAEKLESLAYHDQLTGLPNPALVEDRIEQAIGRARFSGRLVATLAVQVQRLRQIHDLFGRSAVDDATRLIARTLSSAVRSGDTVGRLGQHEFVVALVDIARFEDLPGVLSNLLQAMPASVRIGDGEVPVAVRIGVAVYPRDGTSAPELLRNASLASAEAPPAAGSDFVFYSSAADEIAQENFLIGQELRKAAGQHELRLEYQPIVLLADRSVVGVEALLRWDSARLGPIRPDRFIPIAEESDLIHGIGAWVIAAAAEQSAAWSRELARELRIAVNVSPRQLRDPGLADRIIAAAAVPGVRLGVEVTESGVMDNLDQAIATLRMLKAAGLRVSIDDFGTGYSSLSRLRALPIDNLKIDKSFVRDLAADANAVSVAKSIIVLAHSLNLGVVAEGVETEEQVERLMELGCDAAQGYLFGRPMDAGRLPGFLARGGR
jgi:diguanylate cyclase (GGDEF)-like protein/PAS domain S-box-containing protein